VEEFFSKKHAAEEAATMEDTKTPNQNKPHTETPEISPEKSPEKRSKTPSTDKKRKAKKGKETPRKESKSTENDTVLKTPTTKKTCSPASSSPAYVPVTPHDKNTVREEFLAKTQEEKIPDRAKKQKKSTSVKIPLIIRPKPAEESDTPTKAETATASSTGRLKRTKKVKAPRAEDKMDVDAEIPAVAALVEPATEKARPSKSPKSERKKRKAERKSKRKHKDTMQVEKTDAAAATLESTTHKSSSTALQPPSVPPKATNRKIPMPPGFASLPQPPTPMPSKNDIFPDNGMESQQPDARPSPAIQKKRKHKKEKKEKRKSKLEKSGNAETTEATSESSRKRKRDEFKAPSARSTKRSKKSVERIMQSSEGRLSIESLLTPGKLLARQDDSQKQQQDDSQQTALPHKSREGKLRSKQKLKLKTLVETSIDSAVKSVDARTREIVTKFLDCTSNSHKYNKDDIFTYTRALVTAKQSM